MGRDSPGLLDLILRRKREQLERSGQHDIFGCGWTERLLCRLLEIEDEDFGLRLAALSTRDGVIAAEIGLLSGTAYHLWFPVYDPDFARYSPGTLMTLDTLEAVSRLGVRTVDFGAGIEGYKTSFADPGALVLEDAVVTGRLRAAVRAIPTLSATRARLERRIDRIAACEPTFSRQVAAGAKYAKVTAKRHPTAVTMGLGAAAVLGVSLIAD